MASLPSRAGVLPSQALKPKAPTPRSTGAAQTEGLDGAFRVYLVYLAVEYSGLSSQFPIFDVLHFSMLTHYALLGMVVYKARLTDVLSARQIHLLGGFLGLTVLSMLYAEITTRAYLSLRPLVDGITFAIITIYLLDRRSRIDKVALLFAFIALVLVGRNLNKLGVQTRMGGLRGPYFMGELNDLAWGLNVMMPLTAGLLLGQRRLATRLIGLAGVGACIFGIVQSMSRGGTLGLMAALLYGWWFVSKRRMVGAAVIVLAGLAVFALAPQGYFSRMETVGSYEEDNSAQARLQAWGTSIRMAMDRPLGVGAGNFSSSYGRHYNNPTESRVSWGASRWVNAHSIYFKVLGEFGFLGLGMLLWLIGRSLRDNFIATRVLRSAAGEPIDPRWPALINMSIVGFAVAGAFLSGFDYPHLFLVTALTLSAHRIVSLEQPQAAVAAAVATPHGRSPQGAVKAQLMRPPHLRTAPIRPRSRTGGL